MDHATLKKRQREERDNWPGNLSLRVHRALSWLQRAELCDDNDGRFVFLWISFNAAYAYDMDERYRTSEQDTLRGFLTKLCELDDSRRLEELAWEEFPRVIRVLLDNPYVFQGFWDYQSGRIPESEWRERFTAARKAAYAALGNRDTAAVLGIILNRLYTLRNQLVHGGATWNSGVNREQVRDSVTLIGKLVPLVILTMMDNPDTLWGDAAYPVVD